ncbi:hypothetical protein [Levilactobacillus brevis]|uniref:hypothetical protein n=1 Tax=Levilactobacillus brevis TaxID=1580 RepID=UPI0030D2D91C
MNQMNPRFRDLSVVPTSPTTALVIACDSSAGIGEKPLDAVQIDSAITAAYSLRVPLLELLCFGARPIAVVDTVGNEMVPTGRRVIQGLKRELTKAGFYDIPLNGSTEDNMPTRTTAIGVTVIGQINRKDIPTTSIDDSLIVYQLGTPYVGEAVKAHLATIFLTIRFEPFAPPQQWWICCRWAQRELPTNWPRWPPPIPQKFPPWLTWRMLNLRNLPDRRPCY